MLPQVPSCLVVSSRTGKAPSSPNALGCMKVSAPFLGTSRAAERVRAEPLPPGCPDLVPSTALSLAAISANAMAMASQTLGSCNTKHLQLSSIMKKMNCQSSPACLTREGARGTSHRRIV